MCDEPILEWSETSDGQEAIFCDGCTVNAVDYLQPYLISLVMNRKNLTAIVTAFLHIKEMKLTS